MSHGFKLDGPPPPDLPLPAPDGPLDGPLDAKQDLPPSPDLKPGDPWSRVFGGTGDDLATALALDANGLVYLVGGFRQTVTVGPTPLKSKGGSDVFVASYSPAGLSLWSKSFGATGDDVAEAVTVGTKSDLVLGGTFAQTVNFGGPPLMASGDRDIFIASIDAKTSVHRWSRRAGGPSTKKFTETVRGAALDATGNAYLTGRFAQSVDFGGGMLKGKNTTDVFFVSYGPTGKHRWSKAYGGSGTDWGAGLKMQGSAQLVGVGVHGKDIELGPYKTGSGGTFLASFEQDGAVRWAKGFGNSGYLYGEGVAVDGSSYLAVVGQFSGVASFGTGSLTSGGGFDVFLTSFDDKGGARWSKRFGGPGADAGRGVAVDGQGNIYICGTFDGKVAFGGSNLLASQGGLDVFVASYDKEGKYRWAKRFGGGLNDTCAAVAVKGGAVYAAGAFQGTADFGDGPKTSNGGYDVFLLKLGTAP